MEFLADFIRKHPWWRWLTRTPFAAKMTKYALSSVLAFGLSYVTFTVGYAISGGYTTVPSIVAFLAAAIVNWIMNRRWAWQQTGRAPVKQTVSYACVSLVSLGITALATGRTNHLVKAAHIESHHGLRLLIVSGAYVIINVILFVAKFLVYEYVIFAQERGHRSPLHPTRHPHPVGAEAPVEREPALGSNPSA